MDPLESAHAGLVLAFLHVDLVYADLVSVMEIRHVLQHPGDAEEVRVVVIERVHQHPGDVEEVGVVDSLSLVHAGLVQAYLVDAVCAVVLERVL